MEIGRIIDGRYVVEREIASGGMATVYVVRHTSLDSQHALKILHVPSPEIRERLLQEGRLQARLRHPNIVAVTDTLNIDGAPGLVMDYIEGPSLDDWLADHRPSVDEAERIFLGVLAAVDHAHRHGVVHRDLKPANVLLAPMSGGFLPKVADFGIAKVVADVLDDKGAGRVKTRSGVAMGTPAYMAPEQMESAGKVGPSADVFALGCILYDLMIGKPAFDGPHLVSILTKSREGLYDDPADVRPDLPERVIEAIRGALVPEVEDRIPTVTELARVLTDGRIVTLTGLSGPVEGVNADRTSSVKYPRGLGSDALRSKDTFRADDVKVAPATGARNRPSRVPDAPARPPGEEDHESAAPRGRLWLGILVPLVSLVLVVGVGGLALAGLGGAAGAVYWFTQGASQPPVVPIPERPEPTPDPSPPEPQPEPAPLQLPPEPKPQPQPPEPKPPEPKPPEPKPEPKPPEPKPEPQPPEPKPPEPKPPEPKPPEVKPAAEAGWSLTIHQATEKLEVKNGVFRYAGSPGRTLLIVELTVRNGTPDRVEPTAPFRLVRGGASYEAHLACTLAVTGSISSGTEYPSKGLVRGSVCFEVPSGGSGGEIRFHPQLGGAAAARARLP